jgi:hypothetical protein
MSGTEYECIKDIRQGYETPHQHDHERYEHFQNATAQSLQVVPKGHLGHLFLGLFALILGLFGLAFLLGFTPEFIFNIVDVFVGIRKTLFQALYPLADSLHQFGNFFASENKQNNKGDNQNFPDSEIAEKK